MSPTRDEGKAALVRIIRNVFGLEEGAPLVLALTKERFDLQDILSMPFEDIDNLRYVDAQGNAVGVVNNYSLPLTLLVSSRKRD